jgi:hypothetical protein
VYGDFAEKLTANNPGYPMRQCQEIADFLYGRFLGFRKKYPEAKDTDWVIDLVQDDAEIQTVAARR